MFHFKIPGKLYTRSFQWTVIKNKSEKNIIISILQI